MFEDEKPFSFNFYIDIDKQFFFIETCFFRKAVRTLCCCDTIVFNSADFPCPYQTTSCDVISIHVVVIIISYILSLAMIFHFYFFVPSHITYTYHTYVKSGAVEADEDCVGSLYGSHNTLNSTHIRALHKITAMNAVFN